MPRTDTHLDAMLRHLGAAYYESLHGNATQGDVIRALSTVEDHLNEQPRQHAQGTAASERGASHAPAADQGGPRSPAGWARRVSDVMTTSVVTVDRITPYKEIARLLSEHRISGVPVLTMGRQVAGVVTEGDLLAAEVRTARRLRSVTGRSLLPRRPRPSLTAAELMTGPAITVSAATTIPAAARLMHGHHVRSLPVVDEDGALVGIVSRRDLLSTFLRPDEDIAADIRRVLAEFILENPGDIEVSVSHGVVTLAGTPQLTPGRHANLLPVAIRLMWDVDGVVDVVDKCGQ
jgi:CBS domain-containing protein